MKTGFVLDEIFLEHNPGPFHPERRDRLVAILETLQTYPHAGSLIRLKSRRVSESELGWVHTQPHIERIRQTAGKPSSQIDPDTSTSARSYEAALHAAGSLPVLIDSLIHGEIQNGFAFVRPPGHHAEPGRAMGFCLFNNMAIGASYALKVHGLSRVLVVDFDVHHGNGTQKAFYDRSDVLFVSTHQYPLYPGTGKISETGQGPGLGYTLNFPLPAGTEDSTYNLIFEKILFPLGKAYAPQLILVSAGYDAYVDDPLAGMALTPKGFAGLSRTLLRLAQEVCGGKVVFLLEGGYHRDGLKKCASVTLDELTGHSKRSFVWPTVPPFETILQQARETLGRFWNF